MLKEKNKPINESCDEVCSPTVIHKEVINEVKQNMPSEEILTDVAELFKVLGDKTRTRILHALFQSEMCVCDVANLLGMTQSSISHQLRVLKQAKLVKNRKVGKVVYYSIIDDHVKDIFNQAFEHVTE
jgi:ArsR family transcriptional regulator, lead/cadmium/zinc/bismuth-responsive transcriptional repressor